MPVTRWEESLAELVEARGTALARYAYLLTGDEHDAEDLVQDVIVRVMAGKGRHTGPAQLEAYVRTAMLNRVIDQSRRRKRWTGLLPRLAQSPVQESPERAVLDASVAREALRALSPRQRACVVLRFYDDEPVSAIAARLDMREGTVRRHLADASARLRRVLTPEREGCGDATPR
jgi:RNA polymerase sigma factor (sigma-70 family)